MPWKLGRNRFLAFPLLMGRTPGAPRPGAPGGMPRRLWLASALAAARLAPGDEAPVCIPVLRLLDRNARCSPDEVKRFHETIWDEAVRMFGSCQVTFRVADRPGEIRRYPSGRPLFAGLERPMLNVVLTDTVPLAWDGGRSLAGVSARYEGYDVVVISLKNAHPNRFPVLAANTLVHELLHVLLGDIFLASPDAFAKGWREAAVDWQATRLWLFGGAPAIREAARKYVERLSRASSS